MSKLFVADVGRLQAIVKIFNENRAIAREGKEMMVSAAPKRAAGTGMGVVFGNTKMVPMPPNGSPRTDVHVPMPELEMWWLLKHVERCAKELLMLRMDKAWEGLDLPEAEGEDLPG
jgi:hypothetical protein